MERATGEVDIHIKQPSTVMEKIWGENKKRKQLGARKAYI